ncbi:MAG: LrgB family protein [Betaproteobacteria bacterium]
MNPFVTAFGIAITIAAYGFSRTVAKRYPSPLTTPVFFSTPLVMLGLAVGGLRVDDYAAAREILVFLLGPATVALAVPLYKNRQTLIRNLLPIAVGVAVGALVTLIAALVISRLFTLTRIVATSIAVKSVTAPVAVELADILGGNSSLTGAFVIMTGMVGAMLGPWLLNRIGIYAPVARGLALGTISHGQGTAQALVEGELHGAVAGIAMGMAAVLTSLVAPVLVPLLL